MSDRLGILILSIGGTKVTGLNCKAPDEFAGSLAGDRDIRFLDLELAELLKSLEARVKNPQPDRIHHFALRVQQFQIAGAVAFEEAGLPHQADGFLSRGQRHAREFLDGQAFGGKENAKTQGQNQDAPKGFSEDVHSASFLPIFPTDGKGENGRSP